MITSIWLVAGLACAQFGGMHVPSPANQVQDAPEPEQNIPPPRPAASKITAVTVYQGQAMVTREVAVPEGEGTVELVVTPLPSQTVDGSLSAEGVEGLRVLSTRFRSRAVKEDTRQEVRSREELLKKLAAEARRLETLVAVEKQNLEYLRRLEGFPATTLTGLTEKGRLEGKAILTLSKFVMDTRDARARSEIDLSEQLRSNAEAAEFAQRQLAELSAGSRRIERDAVIVVLRTRRDAGHVRLGYLVGAANWSPQYRLRSAADNAPVRIESVAAVVQQTGEDWPDVRVTLSTARPALDAAPPELLPLKMAIAEAADSGPIDAHDDRSRRVAAELEKSIAMSFPTATPLEDVLKHIKAATVSPAFPEGLPIYVDPIGLNEAEKTSTSPVVMDLNQVPLRTTLKLLLQQLGLRYKINDGLLQITSISSEDSQGEDDITTRDTLPEDIGPTVELGERVLNQTAATEQARELQVTDRPAPGAGPTAEKDSPSVTLSVAGRLNLSSRSDPQLLEVARLELPAEYYAKAAPVLSPRVYRLAKLTNTSDRVLLPGEATVFVGDDFVGRMRLPLVAAGEAFIAGFGVDPQLQVSRRLLHKTRTVQGGNQIFAYEFRIGLRNYRSHPVKVQLWDRLPSPQGEAVAINLGKMSAELSTDLLYLRTARMDNMLRWDLELPQGTVGDKALYLNYEFHLEYARDLPRPRFVSGGLQEGPIGGGAMGGMGGMMGGMGGGGFRAVEPARD